MKTYGEIYILLHTHTDGGGGGGVGKIKESGHYLRANFDPP